MPPHSPLDLLALTAEIFTALLTVSGIVYSVMALWAARRFDRAPAPAPDPTFTPGITILKPVKGVDPRMHAGLASHCAQNYAGAFELLFGVSSLSDPAVAEVARLRVDFPHIPIRLIECPERLGPNGKLSNLTQMLPHARHEHILVNDSDILVSPSYLTHIAAAFTSPATQPPTQQKTSASSPHPTSAWPAILSTQNSKPSASPPTSSPAHSSPARSKAASASASAPRSRQQNPRSPPSADSRP